MKYLVSLLIVAFGIYSCESGKSTVKNTSDTTTAVNDTVRIANDSLEYEILIIEPGFNSWIQTQPPKGYYGLTFLENKNRFFVSEYNNRVRNPFNYSTALYPLEIDYNIGTSYGLEVNYMLYNYFLYFQKKYKQKL
ncbi:DUF6146 family protein [Ulvibacter litoralis]|uniref:Lipoprotein n=1 Tax=Ulvibacter litoralis TaxID=227084 RepID=A0A1G7F9Q0_9FLAO|nr:DUF6146 family protein [Ulvibacter litoralis]GHC52066.1 hypothetical protein GCM10008083_14760 [Ulvibacter litoralis]SDE72678.1 hypothetical protein SAMN05421855_102427 [Ulvibacter litoralis]